MDYRRQGCGSYPEYGITLLIPNSYFSVIPAKAGGIQHNLTIVIIIDSGS